MMVKICGITTGEDALASVDAGAAALGFNFYPKSPRYIEPAAAARITERLPANVWKVGVFVNENCATMADVATVAGLDVIQVHGGGPLPSAGRVWKAVRASSKMELGPGSVEAFLIDTPSDELHGGTGKTFDWSVARGCAAKIILAGGLDEHNVREAIERARPWGVDACSRLESSPGRKDLNKVARFVKAALSGNS